MLSESEKTRRTKGFTLIELLIVVAIIAILAAIAVPNFLEAQTRAKVSRGKADMRSLATAIESYTVDWNWPSPAAIVLAKGGGKCVAGTFSADEEERTFIAYSKYTTPLAYMTSIPNDPFLDKGSKNLISGEVYRTWRPFRYETYIDCAKMNQGQLMAYYRGYRWALASLGPERSPGGGISATLIGPNTGSGGQPNTTRCSYDPSNGTVSRGWIIRTNKGEFTVNTQPL